MTWRCQIRWSVVCRSVVVISDMLTLFISQLKLPESKRIWKKWKMLETRQRHDRFFFFCALEFVILYFFSLIFFFFALQIKMYGPLCDHERILSHGCRQCEIHRRRRRRRNVFACHRHRHRLTFYERQMLFFRSFVGDWTPFVVNVQHKSVDHRRLCVAIDLLSLFLAFMWFVSKLSVVVHRTMENKWTTDKRNENIYMAALNDDVQLSCDRETCAYSRIRDEKKTKTKTTTTENDKKERKRSRAPVTATVNGKWIVATETTATVTTTATEEKRFLCVFFFLCSFVCMTRKSAKQLPLKRHDIEPRRQRRPTTRWRRDP